MLLAFYFISFPIFIIDLFTMFDDNVLKFMIQCNTMDMSNSVMQWIRATYKIQDFYVDTSFVEALSSYSACMSLMQILNF